MRLLRGLPASQRHRAIAVACIAAAQLWLASLWFLYWGHGIARALIVLVVLIGLVLLRFAPIAPVPDTGSRKMPRAIIWGIGLAVLLDLALMAVTDLHSWRTGHIPMDEGQTTWRAARLLWRGDDPYGQGALVDFVAFLHRAPERARMGLAQNEPKATLKDRLVDYDRSLSPQAERKLLPLPPSPSMEQQREVSITGYKYGPVILLVTSLFAPLGRPAAVLWLNGIACFGLYATLWAILRRVGSRDTALVGIAMIALLLDRHITRDYINRSGTDVYSLLFGALGVLAFLKNNPGLAGAGMAFSVGCKLFPGMGFVPILAAFRSPKPFVVFVCVLAALYVPWAIWDAHGLFYNVFGWSLLMGSTPSSWQHWAGPHIVLAARALLLVAIAAVWFDFLLRRGRLFWTLAVSNTLLLLAGATFSNNYVPWASIWIVVAIVEAFSPRPDEMASLQPESAPSARSADGY
ncbi:MAG TPA: glycosyltransferase family 87 protein [Rhizomicrobium sp.]